MSRLGCWWASWRPLLRLARRDAVRARGRSALVLILIALPVVAVTAASVVLRTVDVTPAEAPERWLGAADALVSVERGRVDVEHGPDPDRSGGGLGFDESAAMPTLADVRRLLGRDVPAVERRATQVSVPVDRGRSSAEAVEIDLRDPLAAGLFDLTEGTLPTSAEEVAVNGYLVGRGVAVGDLLDLGGPRTVVGVVESTADRGYPIVVGLPGSLGADAESATGWLIGGGDVTWSEVRALNAIGAQVLSRAVVADPPSASEIPAAARATVDGAVAIVIAMVVTMVLLEVVLLAGPAFAVTARRQARTIALLVATGATPNQARRVVLAGALVLGGLAACGGVAIGVLVGAVSLPFVQRFSDAELGPLDLSPLDFGLVAGLGLLSALLAAAVPARVSSRQDVVAVLAGRRGDSRPGLRSPFVGLLLLAGGVAMAAFGAASGGSEILIALAAVPAVFGMLLIVPALLVGLARASRPLPLPVRYALRDAARHRTRTVPAVGAVAATVVGAVALSIGAASDAAEAEATYLPTLPIGTAALTYSPWQGDPDPVTWQRLRDAVDRALPDHATAPVRGLVGDQWLGLEAGGEEIWLESSAAAYGTTTPVTTTLAGLEVGVPEGERAAAEAVLADGGAVVFTRDRVDATEVRLHLLGEDGASLGAATAPAYFVATGQRATVPAIVSPPLADALEADVAVTGLAIDGAVSVTSEEALSEAVAGITDDASLYVERGYTGDRETTLVLLVLAAVAGVLMLGGTLTATSLALADARPDLATLAAVGAAPRTRRRVAASYALVVGGVGAVLGAAVGFVPGVAVSFPLTGNHWLTADAAGNPLPGHFLDIPWLLIGGLVVALPVITATVVGLTARSRLPLTARTP